ncbi:MAG: MraY family glycosyltransferase [Treponema sp.]
MKIIVLFSFIAFLFSLALLPLIIKLCKIYSLYDTVNSRKIHSGNIPRLGGIAIAVSFVICTALCFRFNTAIGLARILPVLAAGMFIFIFGILDDIIEMRALFKLFVQLTAAGITVAGGFRFRQIFAVTLPAPAGIALTFVWIVGIVNAYNLMDGLDGLAGTLTFTALLTFGFILMRSFPAGSALCFILAASIAGFLAFNWPPAKIFMGDGGSQFLGFMTAVIPLLSSSTHIEYDKFMIMLVLVSFPMLDTIAAIWRRLRDHYSIMSPDRLHLHHKLLNLGLDKKQVLYMIAIMQIILCATVYLSTMASKKAGITLLTVAYIMMIGFYSGIHYINRAVLKKAKDGQSFITGRDL